MDNCRCRGPISGVDLNQRTKNEVVGVVLGVVRVDEKDEDVGDKYFES